MIGLVEACDDRHLLGARMKLWDGQREILAACDIGGQRESVWRIGRRGAKGTSSALVLLWLLCLRPDLDALVLPDEPKVGIIVAGTQAQAARTWAQALAIAKRSPKLRKMIVRVTEGDTSRLEFSNGSVLEAGTSVSDSQRGAAYVAVVVAEAHFWPNEEGPRSPMSMFQALAPGTAQFGDEARIIVESSPNPERGTGGFFYHACVEADRDPEVAYFHRTTEQMNQTISSRFLRKEQAKNADLFACEFEAEWGSGALSSQFIDWSRVTAPTFQGTIAAQDLRPQGVMGLDGAYSGYDTCAAVTTARHPENPDVIVAARCDVFKPPKAKTFAALAKGAEDVLDSVAPIAKLYECSVAIDAHMNKQVTEHLQQKHRLKARTFSLKGDLRDEAFVKVRDRLYAGSLIIPDGELREDLARIRTKVTATGTHVYLPRVKGQHCDRAMALALAVLLQEQLPPERPGDEGNGQGYSPDSLLMQICEATEARRAGLGGIRPVCVQDIHDATKPISRPHDSDVRPAPIDPFDSGKPVL